MSISQEQFVSKFTGKMAADTSGDIVLCELAQSKCTWTEYRSIFVWKFTKNNPGHLRGHRFVRACAVEMDIDISQEPFCVEIYRENSKRPGDHLD
jgi:hypothetical protein